VNQRLFILIFHGVGTPPRPLEPGEEHVWLSVDALRSVLDAAAERGDVQLTFDDANRSDHEIALPELVARGLRATFFVVAERINEPGFLTEQQLRELSDAGMSIQSHGMRHRCWRRLDDASLREELVTARDMIEDMVGQPVMETAIPFCLYDRRVLNRARTLGYRHVYTCDGGPATRDAWLQPRTQISAGEDGARLKEIVAPTVGFRAARAVKGQIKRWR
jgi:peptidoglycan/xylan/chitin deacetylase (PgdA/CDA1 family)